MTGPRDSALQNDHKGRDFGLTADEVSEVLSHVTHAVDELEELLERAKGWRTAGPGAGSSRKSSRPAEKSECDKAFEFFGFAAGSDPSETAIDSTWRDFRRLTIRRFREI